MLRPLMFSMILWLCGLMLLLACDNPELDEARGRLSVMQGQNQVLQQQLSDLQRRFEDMEAERDNLAIKHEEIVQWSRELADSLGPSVWSPGTYERPIPIRFLKSASAAQLVSMLNAHFDSIELPQFKLLRIQNRMAVVQIEEGARLTETLGTTGAQGYLGAVSYTLCSLKSIDCVDFQFEPGSHAVPGPYCR